MYEIEEVLKQKIVNMNSKLKDLYIQYGSLDRAEKRRIVENHIGKLIVLEKMSTDELSGYDGIVGVDGSTNRLGGAYPHYVEIFRGLAKSTNKSHGDIMMHEIYTPFLDAQMKSDEVFLDKRNQMLASIELDVAIESAKTFAPSMIMMDGGLIRYRILDRSRYEELCEICEESGIILVGLIKDIKTDIISKTLGEVKGSEMYLYDRELLNGVLDIGECILIDDSVNRKYAEDSEGSLSSAFMRLSNSPNAVGMDILHSQKEQLVSAAQIAYSLTPKNSRGVPLWIDIVDSEVKIGDDLLEFLLKDYLDRDVFELFFNSERMNRTL